MEAVLRAGFGTFLRSRLRIAGGASSYFPYYSSNVFLKVPFPLSAQQAVPPQLTTNPPVGDIVVADPDLKLPRTYEWNVALEQSLGSNRSLSFTYVGAIGRDLLRVTDLVSVRIRISDLSP